MIQRELKELTNFLRRNTTEVVILASAMLFLVLAEHHSIWSRWADSLIFYAVLPLLSAYILLGKRPRDFGVGVGDFRTWRIYVLVTCLVSLPVLVITAQFDSFKSYYTINDFCLPTYLLRTMGYQAGWEFIYRGYLLFGLRERFGERSILIQMIPFLFLHLGKPEAEVISTIPTGIYFGWVAYRGGSFWPVFLIHVFINVTFRILVNW